MRVVVMRMVVMRVVVMREVEMRVEPHSEHTSLFGGVSDCRSSSFANVSPAAVSTGSHQVLIHLITQASFLHEGL